MIKVTDGLLLAAGVFSFSLLFASACILQFKLRHKQNGKQHRKIDLFAISVLYFLSLVSLSLLSFKFQASIYTNFSFLALINFATFQILTANLHLTLYEGICIVLMIISAVINSNAYFQSPKFADEEPLDMSNFSSDGALVVYFILGLIFIIVFIVDVKLRDFIWKKHDDVIN